MGSPPHAQAPFQRPSSFHPGTPGGNPLGQYERRRPDRDPEASQDPGQTPDPNIGSRGGACILCHDPHGSHKFKRLINFLWEADGIFVNVPGNPLSWLARDSSKPGRSPGERWILHAGPEWSMTHVEDDRSSVVSELLESMQAALQLALPPATYSAAHRWRYALTSSRVDGGALFDRDRRVAIAGDWCNGGRVEGAFLSGCAAADMLLRGFESKSS